MTLPLNFRIQRAALLVQRGLGRDAIEPLTAAVEEARAGLRYGEGGEALRWLARIHAREGEYEQEHKILQDAYEWHEKTWCIPGMAGRLVALTNNRVLTGDYKMAEKYARQALTLCRESRPLTQYEGAIKTYHKLIIGALFAPALGGLTPELEKSIRSWATTERIGIDEAAVQETAKRRAPVAPRPVRVRYNPRLRKRQSWFERLFSSLFGRKPNS